MSLSDLLDCMEQDGLVWDMVKDELQWAMEDETLREGLSMGGAVEVDMSLASPEESRMMVEQAVAIGAIDVGDFQDALNDSDCVP